MEIITPPLDRLSDSELTVRVSHLARCERAATAALVAALAESDG